MEFAFTVGFTGTQEGMTQIQKELVSARLRTTMELYKVCKAVHGYCIGADDEFGIMAMNQDYFVEVFPGCNDNGDTPKLGTSAFDLKHMPVPYLARNGVIAHSCDVLIATPRTMEEELRSGTWATIRYAKKIGKPVDIVWPRR